MKFKVIHNHSSHFPKRLLGAQPAVENIYVNGTDLNELLKYKTLAIVGSRKATPYGRRVTEEITSVLARSGIVIISGLAIGIDGFAHKSCLSVNGKTIAVLPNGLDQIYPSHNITVANQILSNGGCLLSEYPENSITYKSNFIARNRIIACLADAVLIIEAAEKSGSLHTAKFALEQGKTVFAIPGSIYSSYSVGTNNLIKSGAIPITKPKEILDYFGYEKQLNFADILPKNPEEQIIIKLLKDGVIEGQDLLLNSGLPISVFNQTMTLLEIQKLIKPLGANRWTLVSI